MNSGVYTEDTLVQQTTADYLHDQLGWDSIYAYNNEDFGPDSLLGRASDREVVLTRPLREKLIALNPGLPDAAYDIVQNLRYVVEQRLQRLLQQNPLRTVSNNTMNKSFPSTTVKKIG